MIPVFVTVAISIEEAKRIEKIAEKENLDEIILVVPMEVRHMIFMIFSQYMNNISVLAREEVTNYYNFESIAEV